MINRNIKYINWLNLNLFTAYYYPRDNISKNLKSIILCLEMDLYRFFCCSHVLYGCCSCCTITNISRDISFRSYIHHYWIWLSYSEPNIGEEIDTDSSMLVNQFDEITNTTGDRWDLHLFSFASKFVRATSIVVIIHCIRPFPTR